MRVYKSIEWVSKWGNTHPKKKLWYHLHDYKSVVFTASQVRKALSVVFVIIFIIITIFFPHFPTKYKSACD